jgi:mono/diheme cytochrome c family protein
MTRRSLATFLCAACMSVPAGFADAQDDRGAYLARIMDCGGCHTPGALKGQPDMSRYLGGSDVGFEIPGLGIFYPPNLTSDATGAGSWSEEEIMTAVRTGVRPDGRQLIPIMPYHSYSALTDEDARALARFLKSAKPVSNEVPDPVGPGQKAPLPYLTLKMPE